MPAPAAETLSKVAAATEPKGVSAPFVASSDAVAGWHFHISQEDSNEVPTDCCYLSA